MSTRFYIAVLVYMMAAAVLFGIGIVPVLAVPALAERAFALIPAVVLASSALAAPISWLLAPRLRARYWRTQPVETRIG